MKKCTILFLATLVILSLAACGGGKAKELDLTTFTQQVVEQVQYDDEMIPLNEQIAKEYYDLEFSGLEGWAAYGSGTRATANELMVMKLKDSTAVEAAKKSIQGRLDNLTADYEGYRPDELFRLENAVIETKGNYLIFSASPDNDTVKKLFEDALK